MMTNNRDIKAGARAWSFPLSEERKKEVEKIARTLPMDEAAVVYLKYWLNMGFGQIAKTLGMKFYDVCIAHENAIAILKERLLKVKI
jgi:DNA-directed RNA polymerase specialized sigma24 family protein